MGRLSNAWDTISGAGSSASETARDTASSAIPDELKELAELTGEQIDNLVEFAQAPFGFMISLFIDRLILPATTYTIEAIQLGLAPLVSIPGIIASPLILAGSTLYGATATVISMLNSAIVTVSMAAGPASPIVVLVIWLIIAIYAFEAARRGIRMLPQVIPWL